ncbi:MAG: hypothetical protein ACKVI3_00020 [Verrucomicrobiia bacterium]
MLLIGGNVSTNQLDEEQLVSIADLSTLAAVQHPEWIACHYFEPGSRIALLKNWDNMVEQTLKRTRKRDISLIAGNPQWLLAFSRQALKRVSTAKRKYAFLAKLWPQLRCIVLSGDFPAPITGQLKKIAGYGVMMHEAFATAEAVIAAQGPGSLPGLRLLAETGVYFEFLPLDDYDPAG